MKWEKISLGPLQTNCFIVHNHKECLIFDPGGDENVLVEWLKKNQLKPLAILLTHAHFDHIGAVEYIRDHYQIPLYLHENEKDWLKDPSLNGSQFFMGNSIQCEDADVWITQEESMKIGPFSFQILFTPGHSPGSVSYYFHELNAVVSGDALFQNSIGRTDLPGGNLQQLMHSIHHKLLQLPEQTEVLPGHGPTTTIQNEMDTNPFLNGFTF